MNEPRRSEGRHLESPSVEVIVGWLDEYERGTKARCMTAEWSVGAARMLRKRLDERLGVAEPEPTPAAPPATEWPCEVCGIMQGKNGGHVHGHTDSHPKFGGGSSPEESSPAEDVRIVAAFGGSMKNISGDDMQKFYGQTKQPCRDADHHVPRGATFDLGCRLCCVALSKWLRGERSGSGADHV